MTANLYSGGAIATRYGVSRSAVSNWIKREILPEECRPVKMNAGGDRHTQVWTEDQLPKLDAWMEGRQEGKTVRIPKVPKAMQEAIDMVLGTVPGHVFFNHDFEQALILSKDETYVVRVCYNGRTDEAWLSSEPMERFVGLGENEHAIHNEDLPDLQGFGGSFTT